MPPEIFAGAADTMMFKGMDGFVVVEFFVKLASAILVSAVLAGVGCVLRAELGKRDTHASGRKRRLVSAVFISAIAVTLVGCAVAGVLRSDSLFVGSLVCPAVLAVICAMVMLLGKRHCKTGLVVIIVMAVLGVCLSLVPLYVNANGDVDIDVSGDRISIKGSFGEEIMLGDIRQVSIVDTLPRISIRVAGSSFGGVRRGRFKTDGSLDVWLYSYSGTGPFVRIDTKDGREFYVNSRDSLRTRRIYTLVVTACRKRIGH